MNFVLGIKPNKKYLVDNNKYVKIYDYEQLKIKNIREKIVDEITFISKNTVGIIAPYPIMKGFDYENKIIIICYNNNNEPIATNISFYFFYENIKICHLGLFLIIPEYQQLGIQKNLATYMLSYYYCFHNISYYTDIGRSASGFKALDLNFTCYPSLHRKNTKEFENFSKNVAYYLYINHSCRSCGVSDKSKYDKDKMVIYDSNIKDGDGFIELLDKNKGQYSRSGTYNNFVNKLCPNLEDEFIIMFQLNFKFFFIIIKTLLTHLFYSAISLFF